MNAERYLEILEATLVNSFYQECSQEFLVGGMKPSGARRIEGAKRPSYTRGVRGHDPPGNFEKMDTKWCILEPIWDFFFILKKVFFSLL